MLSQCKLCMLTEKLIRAHVIPQSFFEPNNLLISDNSPFTKRRPTGSYDTGILCGKCDSEEIGKLDDYAKEVLIDRKGIISETFHNPLHPEQVLTLYRLKDKTGYDKLNRFFISILWRASVSSHEDFAAFNLGPYEQAAKNAILDTTYDFSAIFSVALCLFTNLSAPIHLFPSKLTRVDSVNFYIPIIGFYKAFIKCDKRRLPARLQSFVLSIENDILMVEGDLTAFPEHKTLIEMAKKTQRNKKRRH